MSHVDEGALHAYLDGALDALPASEAARIRQHLASCGECTRRLEEERALREEAAAILAGADPGVGVVAPLEELRQRAAARTRTGSGSRLRQLTWAASLVLAVGAGWMLRGSRDPRISQALDPLLREAAEERAVPAGAEAVAAEAEAVPAEAEAVPAGEAAPPAEERAAPSEAVEAGPSSPSAQAAPPAPAGAGVVRAPEVEERLAGAAAMGAPARAQAANVLGVEQARTNPAADAVPAKATADVAPAMAVAAEALAREAPRAMARERATLVASDQQAAIAVPGLPILAVEAGRADLPAGTLRVLQLLGADTLELLHLPAGADPSAVTGPGGAGRTEVAVRYGAGWLLGRAHRPADVIEALLARVTGGG